MSCKLRDGCDQTALAAASEPAPLSIIPRYFPCLSKGLLFLPSLLMGAYISALRARVPGKLGLNTRAAIPRTSISLEAFHAVCLYRVPGEELGFKWKRTRHGEAQKPRI
ncbi:hypothetical protein LIA77_06428 [Sarocladium implicatum]|nr:hypothetical protein LIA77_06428 [Sarocladium implicatum]